MRDKPYAGMGKVSKAEGLYLKKKNKRKKILVSIPDGFVQVPISFLKDLTNVKDNDILVYNALGSFAENVTKIAWPFLETISKIARRNERLVMRTIAHLVEIGWCTKIRRGLCKSNIYRLHLYKGQKFTEEELEAIKKAAEDEITKFSR